MEGRGSWGCPGKGVQGREVQGRRGPGRRVKEGVHRPTAQIGQKVEVSGVLDLGFWGLWFWTITKLKKNASVSHPVRLEKIAKVEKGTL